MPDHAHLLVQDRDVVEFVRLFKGKMVSKALTREPERPLWQRSFYDHALRKEEALEDVARYVGENPVRCGLVGHPRAYYLVRVGSVA
jgi:putative transposase